jgi:hypothetical protein
MAETQDLIARLEKLTGPDREVDCEIHEASGHCIHRETSWVWSDGHSYLKIYTCNACLLSFESPPPIPAYTASLDAQKSLAHPDWQVSSGNCGEDDGPWACVTTPGAVDHTEGEGGAATEELARLIALMKAIGATK